MSRTHETKMKVSFLCTGNSCRSQMAEGWTRHPKGDVVVPYSAGSEAHSLNPNAVKVMAEVGVDISHQRSRHVDVFEGIEPDHVVTVCGHANRNRPFLPGPTKVIHVGFDDGPQLANTAKNENEALAHCWRARGEIRASMETVPEALNV